MKALIVIVLGLVLAGCAWDDKTSGTRVVTEYRYQLTEIPGELLQDCKKAPPPDRASFGRMNSDQQQQALALALAAQYELTDECTKSKVKIRELQTKQRETLKKLNEAEAKVSASTKKE